MQPFRYLLLKKTPSEVDQFIKSIKRFYPIDLINFFSMNNFYVYKCFSYIKETEGISTKYIPQSIMKKYLEIRS